MRKSSAIAVLALFSASVLSAHADVLQYNLTFDDGLGDTADATFTSTDYITTDTTLTATGSSSAGPVTSVAAYMTGDCPVAFGPFACFVINPETSAFDLILDTLPDTTGTFYDIFGDGDVNIQDISITNPPAVPEPSSLILLGTGALSAAGAVRRRLL